MKIKTKLILTLASSLAIFLIIFLLLFSSYRQIQHIMREEQYVDVLLMNIYSMNALSYNYFLYQEQRVKIQWMQTNQAIAEQLNQGAPFNNYRLDDFIKLSNSNEDLRKLFMELVKCSENIEFSYQNPRISEWRNRLIGQIAVAMQNMFFDVSQIKKTHREAEKHLQQKFYSLIFLLITVATLLLVASFFWIYRSLINPIIQLQKGAEIIGAGNLNYQIQLSGHDEISELSRSFNAMTEKLSLYLAELEKEIKKRIETEEKMLELNKDLEKAVQDEIDKRGKHEQVLLQQSKLAAMGEMMSAIAHHWRQPLNVINLINFNILSAFHEGELDEAYLEKAVDDSKKQVLYLSKTIDNFRNYYKPSNVKTEFDIKDAAAEAFNLLSSELQINYIDYSLSCHIHNKTFYNYSYNQCCNEMKATLYKNEFIQVLMNLIYNARDAILKKREAGLLGIQHGSIDIGFYKLKNNRLRIVVEDNGGGIPEDIMDRIFEPYFTTKFQSQGAGIGLYMTKLLIEKNMNGVIYAQNIEEGAQLIIEFDQEQSR